MKFNVFATSPQGFSCHLELEGEKVYKDAILLLAQLAADGFTPRGQDVPNSTNGHPHWCEAHQTEYKRMSKGDSVWYSHRIEGANKWCREESKG